nr:uncharacterized protein LOC129011671 isoform X2 [Pongo pygmaeus]
MSRQPQESRTMPRFHDVFVEPTVDKGSCSPLKACAKTVSKWLVSIRSSEDSFSETSYNNSSSSGDTPASGAGMEESHHADDHQHMPTSPLPAPAEKAIETKPEQQKKWYPVGGVEAGPHRSGAQSWGLKESGEEMLERVKRRIDGQRTSEDEKVLSSAEMNLMQNVVCENEEGRWVMDLSCHTSFMSKQNVMS